MTGLVIDAVSRAFDAGPRLALDAVSLAVEQGSCTAVLGPSGSGKTTLLRAVAGLERLDGGRISFGDEDLAAVRPEHRDMVLVSQRPLLFPYLNVLDNIAFALTVRGVRRKAARAEAGYFLDLVHLEGFGDRRVAELSGGQRQRVAIARALAARPRVLLLDEPFSALDQELRSAMHELLDLIRAELSPTLLMVTHDRAEAAAVADRMALLSAGRLLQHDAVQGLYARPASLEVHRLMGGLNEVPGTVRDGVHHSALGGLPLPGGPPRPDGPGILVVRQESIGVRRDGPDGAAEGVPAEVVGVRSLGPRRLLTLAASGVTLHAEAPGAFSVDAGDTVRLEIPLDARAVVPGAGQRPNASASSVSAATVTSGASKYVG